MTVRTVKCAHEDNIKNCLDCWEKFTGENQMSNSTKQPNPKQDSELEEQLEEILKLYKRYPYGDSAAGLHCISGDEAKQRILNLIQTSVQEAMIDEAYLDYNI